MPPAQFLNVDLDLRNEHGLSSLVRTLAPKVFVLHEEETYAVLELATGTTPPLDEVLNRLIDVVECLSPPARALWNRCQSRRMNIGFEAGDEGPQAGFLIPLPTLKRLIGIHADVEVTIYPRERAQEQAFRMRRQRPTS